MGHRGRPTRRRTAAETREAILAAAERRLLAGGPEALRLTEIAAAAGVSHPLILHHFHSRTGLVETLLERVIDRFGSDLLAALATPGGTTLLEGVDLFWQTFGEKRYAHLFAWLVLSRRTPRGGADARPVAEALHAARVRGDVAAGRPEAPFDDTRFAITLMTVALFGDALIGRAVRRRFGLRADASTDRRFRVWLANLLEHARGGIPQRWT